MTRYRQIVYIPDRAVPTDHPFIQGVFCNELRDIDGVNSIVVGRRSKSNKLDEEYYRTYHIPGWLSWSRGLVEPFILLWYLLVKIDGQYDVIVTRNKLGALFASQIAVRTRGGLHVHQISFLHAEGILQRPYAPQYRKILARMYISVRDIAWELPDGLLPISRAMARMLTEHRCVPAKKVCPMPLGVRSDNFQDIPGLSSRKLDLMYVGSVASDRNPSMVLDIIEDYISTYGDIRALILGTSHRDRDIERFREQLARRNLQRVVTFNDNVRRKMVLEKLKSAVVGLSLVPPLRIFTMSSPTKMFEYMASGCVTVANKEIEEQEYIVTKSNGGLLVNYSVSSVREAIRCVLSNRSSAQKIADRGRKFVLDNRSFSIHSDRLLRFIEDLG